MKQKIWSNEYIDLAQLLKPSDWGQYSLALTTGTGAPALCLQPKRKAKLVSINQWCSAFNLFMTNFLTKFPSQAQSILQYCETVRRIEKAGGDFVSIDENVRIQRQNNPTARDTFNAEQYVVAMTTSTKQPSSTFTPIHKVPEVYALLFTLADLAQAANIATCVQDVRVPTQIPSVRLLMSTHIPLISPITVNRCVRILMPFVHNLFAPSISSPLHHTNLVIRRHKDIPSLSDDPAISRDTHLPTEYHLSHRHLPLGWVPPTPINIRHLKVALSCIDLATRN